MSKKPLPSTRFSISMPRDLKERAAFVGEKAYGLKLPALIRYLLVKMVKDHGKESAYYDWRLEGYLEGEDEI